MKVFVTGGSGFVGGHLIETLARAGHPVRALARSQASADAVAARGASPVLGDLDQLSDAHIGDAEVVIHAAAFVKEWGTREQFWAANVLGTERALKAARLAGARRFVHVGTEAALFDGHDLLNIDEAAPYPAVHRFLYSETKAEAEKRVLAANSTGLHTLSIRPRLVWGPGDTSVLPAILAMARAGRFAWLDGGRQLTSTTHVANLAHALTLALEQGRGGRAYFVADPGERTMREFLTALAATQGVDLGDRALSSGLARPLSRAVEAIWRALGLTRDPPMTAFAVHMMSASVTVRTDRARAELGYQPVITVEQGLAALQPQR